MKKEAAFSGLEAAIVLIAFVVVAAVFSYVMLGAGFFATQKSQEVTYSGIKQSTSNLVIDGQLYGDMDGTYTYLNVITLYLSIPEGGQPQDLGDVSFIITVQGAIIDDATIIKTGNSGVLQPGDREEITLEFDTDSDGPEAGQSFTIEVKPRVGASSLITKTLSTGYNGGVII